MLPAEPDEASPMDMDIFPDRPLDAEPTRAVINHTDCNYKI
jgi:methyl coenzyme M reductase subunit D